MTQKRLDGRVAIVTGAAQGLGAAFAKALAGEGAKMCVADVLDARPVAAEIERAGGRAIAVHCDVTDSRSVQAMVAATVQAFGSIVILVNNAGLFASLPLRPMLEIDSAEWDKVMAVNVRGVFECVKAVAPQMKQHRYGKIINLSSGTVFKGAPSLLHYVTSKGAVLAMTRSMARELGDDGICVNTLAPGLILSEGVTQNAGWTGAVGESTVASRALKREGVPADLLGTLIYLASADSDFVTGQAVVVDGGSVMH
jgi:NAD(P)-dependent dehydrogenase (short-subunit alcohol dehydrogenase family)